jgi:hypothetical protein
MATSQQCALGKDGQLLDASQIAWFDDVDSDKPLPTIDSRCTESSKVSG